METFEFNCPDCDIGYDNVTSLNRHWTRTHKKSSQDLYNYLFIKEENPVCACGCEETPLYKSITKGYQKYVHGHNTKPPIKFNKNIEKYCPKCKKVLSLDRFGKRSDNQKYQSYCNVCSFDYREDRREEANERARLWYKDNKDKVIKRMSNRFHSDIEYQLILNCRRYVNQKIKQNVIPAKKAYKTLDLLGCTVEKLKEHLESYFEEGMTWESYGANGWHIDHVVPCSLFDFTDPEQQKKCFHYSNLRPMHWRENISKGNKILNKIIKSEDYSGSCPITVDGHKITKHMLNKMSILEKESLLDEVFHFYRKNGFPYPIYEDKELISDFRGLLKYDVIGIGEKINLSSREGLKVFKHFCPQFFEASSAKSPSMIEAFENDETLKNVISNRMGITYKESFNISGAMIRQGLKNSYSCARTSTFRPIVAKAIYEKYVFDNATILDFSMGFGQRLLGILSLDKDIKYIACDPYKRNVDSGQAIHDFLLENDMISNKKIEFINCGMEDLKLEDESIDFAFSSPPYYNKEIYCLDTSQAYHNRTYSEFLEWWDNSLKNIYPYIKKGGVFSFNISNDISNDMDKVALKYFKKINELSMEFPNSVVKEQKGEPIFVYCKE